MKQYLPSKKFIYTLAAVLLALVIVYGVNILSEHQKTSKQNELAATEKDNKMQAFLALNSDGDDLKDWEEALWKTDPKKEDTDSDGTSDSEEVKVDRNPLKANTAPKNQTPNDKISDEIIAERIKNEEEFAKLTTTDKVGRVLLTQYLVTKKAGESISTVDIANVINNALSTIPAPVFTKYEATDIRTFSPKNDQEVILYLEKVASIITENTPKPPIDFNQVVASIADTDSNAEIKAKLEKLRPLAEAHGKIALGLLSLSAPNKLALNHLGLLNAFSAIRDNLIQTIDSVNDPVQMLNLINTYQDSARNLEAMSRNISVI
jgi:hypothetical protein